MDRTALEGRSVCLFTWRIRTRGDHLGPAIATARRRLCSGRRCNRCLSRRPRLPRARARAHTPHASIRLPSLERRLRSRRWDRCISVADRRHRRNDIGLFLATVGFQVRRPLSHRIASPVLANFAMHARRACAIWSTVKFDQRLPDHQLRFDIRDRTQARVRCFEASATGIAERGPCDRTLATMQRWIRARGVCAAPRLSLRVTSARNDDSVSVLFQDSPKGFPRNDAYSGVRTLRSHYSLIREIVVRRKNHIESLRRALQEKS